MSGRRPPSSFMWGASGSRRPHRRLPFGTMSPPPHGRPIMSAFRWILRALVAATLVAPASAQQFPTRPIVLVVPYAAGGNVDISTRALQSGLGASLGQPALIENRPGAGRTLAGHSPARAAPDGHTLFVGSNAPVMLGPMTMPKPPY